MIRNSILGSVLMLLFACNNTAEKPASSEPVPSAENKTMDSISNEIEKAKQLQASGKYDEALKIAEAMIQIYPGQLDALSIKSEILKAQGKGNEALQQLEKAYAMQPRDKETAYNLAYEYAEVKNAKALSLADTLIKYDQTYTVARAWYIKGVYYNNTGNHNEALRYFDSSIISDYNFTDAYFDKGRMQFQQKNFEAAQKTFAIGQKLAPGEADFYYWIAKTQEAMGNLLDAKANYERAFALDKTFVEAKQAADKL